MPLIKSSKYCQWLMLALIFAISLFLRFYKLDRIPNGFYVDEALTGYNAYSIALTGKDEYGKLLPLAFRYFGSYSPPLYVYLTSLVIKFLGLSVFSTRLLSATCGVVSVLIVMLLIKTLKITKNIWVLALGAFLFSISPWSLFFSRVGYEIYFGFTLFSLGVLFFWLGLNKTKLLVLGFVVLALATYTAHIERYLVLIFVLVVIMVFRKTLFSLNYRKFFLISLVLFFVVCLPNLYLLTTNAFGTKNSMFFQNALISQTNKLSVVMPRLISPPLAFSREFLAKYVNYYSPKTLFFLADPDPQRSAPELPVLYSWMVIPFLVGLCLLWQKRKEAFFKYLLIMLIVFPLPSVLTNDPFSSQRALPFLLPVFLTIMVGLEYLLARQKTLGFGALLLLICLSLVCLWRSYFVLLPKERARVWGYGFEQLADEIKKRPNEDFLIDQSRLKPAYIELLFFLEYPPEKFQTEQTPYVRDQYYFYTQFSDVYRFGHIETRTIDWQKDIYRDQIIVGDEFSISPTQAKEHFLTEVFTIRDPVGMIVFRGFKTNPKQKWAATKN